MMRSTLSTFTKQECSFHGVDRIAGIGPSQLQATFTKASFVLGNQVARTVRFRPHRERREGDKGCHISAGLKGACSENVTNSGSPAPEPPRQEGARIALCLKSAALFVEQNAA